MVGVHEKGVGVGGAEEGGRGRAGAAMEGCGAQADGGGGADDGEL